MTPREAAALKMNGNDAEAVAVRLGHLRPMAQALEILLRASEAGARASGRRSPLEEA